PLVMDKWRTLQATAPLPGTLARVRALAEAEDFPWKNPNRFRSLIGAFAANPWRFHDASGEGYRFLADWLLRLDPINPQTAARTAGAFETWRRYDETRRRMIRDELGRIAETDGLSKDLREIAERILGT
ncbi:MAG TPA: aminopeptidase N C-terminal domain-containing protein, partial [Paracoccaceae bacterium]|nr:aminopeptidase N C-terminal domain-containing protein [Paracoccaceae bacterium]